MAGADGVPGRAAARMTHARWARLTPLIDAALDLEPAARPAYLARVTAEDAELGAELARLVNECGAGDDPLLDEAVADADPEALLQLNDALDRLADVDARLARVVECRFFGGLTSEEIAEALGVTVRTVERDWTKARMLLRAGLA